MSHDSTAEPSRRTYTDAERARALAALAANNNSAERTAAQLGIPARTLREWRLAEARMPAEVQALRQQYREELAARFEALAEACLDVVEAKVHELGAKDAAVIAGIAVDKTQVLRGQPESIIETRGPEQDERAAAIRHRYGRRLGTEELAPSPN